MHPLFRYISEGEHVRQDFKKTITSARKIAKTLAAFANTKGGRLLIGVNDSGKITGVDAQEEYHMIESAAHFFCSPVVPFTFQEHVYDGKEVLEIDVPESAEKPHAAKDDDGQWIVYVRVNDKVAIASKEVTDVLRRETLGENTLIKMTSKEQALIEYLGKYERITLQGYCKLLNLSERRASRILVNLVSAGIIKVHTTEKFDYYTL